MRKRAEELLADLHKWAKAENGRARTGESVCARLMLHGAIGAIEMLLAAPPGKQGRKRNGWPVGSLLADFEIEKAASPDDSDREIIRKIGKEARNHPKFGKYAKTGYAEPTDDALRRAFLREREQLAPFLEDNNPAHEHLRKMVLKRENGPRYGEAQFKADLEKLAKIEADRRAKTRKTVEALGGTVESQTCEPAYWLAWWSKELGQNWWRKTVS
jgi:hypothetical protein